MRPIRALLCLVAASATLTCASPVDVSSVGRQWDAWPWMTTDFIGTVGLSGTTDPDSEPGQAFVRLLVANPGPAQAQVQFGSCSFGIRLYANSELTGDPIWDNRPPAGSACTMELRILLVPAQGNKTMVTGVIDRSAIPGGFALGRNFVAITYRDSSKSAIRLIAAGTIDR